ncbi:hypothetical protein [Corynebacterium matruchotii]|uniref:YobI family P-loop NTPase n=1 Tax=Corynebacterium matruchotii TaxID=43768 RepID=UPI0028EF4E16|nr:hypothetical protein [Corynebacterium matruchotii]
MSTDPDSPQEVSNPEASKQPDQGGKSIDEKSDGVVNPPAQEKQNPNASSELIVLSPHYDEKHHGLYAEKLEQAVLNPKVRNIALTGGYGAGKSSVIQGLIERIHSSKELEKTHPIVISLPTIQVADESDFKNDRTDRIQREIVKQLLYRSNPRKMRGSQYRRITHVTAHQRVITCFIVAAFLTFTFWLLAKPDWHWHWAQGGSLWGYWQPIMVQAILWGLTLYTDWVWVDKPTIKGLELGPTKLELEKNSSGSSYFDQCLNEIIYYFEVSGVNFVIFEDLDRFDDPYIFDALHELNELINISLGQERFTEQKNPPVKFLYATRDSIFEHKTKGIIENADARYTHRLEIENRTKFFDVIVPIIPFSTSRNAYEYLKQLIDSSAFPIAIDRKLLEIVGSAISDYRLLANIVSEFQIFTERISTSWGGNKEVEEFLKDHANYLFAFIVYKNTHLTDYEKIQTEESNIDKINIKFLIMKYEIRAMSQRLFRRLKNDLRAEIDKKYKVNPYLCSLSINGKRFDDFTEVELWQEALNLSLSPNRRTAVLLIDRNGKIISDDIINDFGGNIFSNLITNKLADEESLAKIENNCLEIIDNIKSLNYIDSISSFLHQSYNYRESTLPENIQKKVEDFESFLNKICRFDQIIFELMRSGYIDRNFYAYSSIFTKGFTNIKVFNFVINNLVTKQPNIHLQLTEDEAKEITYHLESIENRYCNLKGALNVDLMLYLTNDRWLLSSILNDAKYFFESPLQSDKTIRIELINTVLKRFLDDGEKEKNNLSGKINNNDNIRRLLEKIMSVYPNIFLECFNNLTEKQKYSLIDSALGVSDLPTTIDIKQYVEENAQDIISYIKSVNAKMQNCSNETIVSSIAVSLGLNPLITPHYKRVMKLMLPVKLLRNISEKKIDTIGILSDIRKKVEFYDPEKRSWISSRELTKHELERILFAYERIVTYNLEGSLKLIQLLAE